MKKNNLLIVVFLVFAANAVAQVYAPATNNLPTTNPSTNYVGIGTDTPLEKLHINGHVRGTGPGGQVPISTGNGILYLGPRNTSWAHIETDRPKFFFNKPLTVDGGISSYDANNLLLQTTDVTRITILNSNGYVGVGTSTPASTLHVTNSNPRETFRVYMTGNPGNYLNIWQGSGGGAIDPIGTGLLYLGYDQSTNVLVGKTGGNLGVGAMTPDYKLHIKDGPLGDQLKFQRGSGIATIKQDNNANNLYIDASAGLLLNTAGGNVGIGTTAPDERLTVKGTIHTNEVRVDTEPEVVPDYVFEPDYDLATLSEIETYIKENKHLPEVPSAKEMEENGMNLKEMNLILLKKVEELTLHLIEQSKTVGVQQDEIRKLQEEIEKNKN